VMICGTMHTTEIVRHQSSGGFFDISRWFVWTPWGFAGFMLYVIALIAESNRSPFDIPEGESEIVAGFHTEYSSMKFAMFFLGEYLGMIAMAALGATLFLGGWNGPRLLPSWTWFCLKTFAIICALIWFRGTFPRLRVDQLMSFAWKALLPFALLNIVAAAIWFYMPKTSFALGVVAWFASAAVVVIAYVVISRVLAARVLERRVYRFAS